MRAHQPVLDALLNGRGLLRFVQRHTNGLADGFGFLAQFSQGTVGFLQRLDFMINGADGAIERGFPLAQAFLPAFQVVSGQLLLDELGNVDHTAGRVRSTRTEQAQAVLALFGEPFAGVFLGFPQHVEHLVIFCPCQLALGLAQDITLHQGCADQLDGGHVRVLLVGFDFLDRRDARVVKLVGGSAFGGQTKVVVIAAPVGEVDPTDVGDFVVDHHHLLVMGKEQAKGAHVALLDRRQAPDFFLRETGIQNKRGHHGFQITGINGGLRRQPGHEVDVRCRAFVQRMVQAVPQPGFALQPHFVVDLPAGNEDGLLGVFYRIGNIFEVVAAGGEKLHFVARALR